ncbi:hypothetical protein BDC45DRAFT_537975 [Circinella umbellata]|nr:hypothetical protein BDC45DRAFT_537975 [Circinella umbellata]
MPYPYVRADFIIAVLKIKESVQTNLDCALMLHQNRIPLFEVEGWELYDEIHRRQWVKLSVDIKEQIAQMYFETWESKDIIAVKFNVSRRAICRVLAKWNEIGRALHLLERRLCISGCSPHVEIGTRLRRLSIVRDLWIFLVA